MSYQDLLQSIQDRCAQKAHGHILCIHDTTEINYQRHAGRLEETDPDLGPVGNDKDIGFFAHPMLAVAADSGFPIGLAGLYLWNRSFEKQDKHQRKYSSLPIEEKESFRWLQCSEEFKRVLPEAQRLTIISDRESDIYEEWVRIPDDRTNLVIRCRSDRRLFDNPHSLYTYLSRQQVCGTFDIKLRTDQRVDRKQRKAVLEVRHAKVKIARPEKLSKQLPDFVELYVVQAQEIVSGVGKGYKPICWNILTTHEVNDMHTAFEIIQWYKQRWLIEQLIRSVKSEGLNLEASQLESGAGLKKLTVMAFAAALQIIQLTLARDGSPQYPATLIFEQEQLACLAEIGRQYEGNTVKLKNPYPSPSMAWAAWIIARMGGWKGYKSQAPPGPITMKRGMNRFSDSFIGWNAASLSFIDVYRE